MLQPIAMSRWILFSMCAVAGLLLLACGWLVPAHLQAVDVGVLQQAGAGTPNLAARGLQYTREKNLGAAQMILQVAGKEHVPDRDQLGLAVGSLEGQHPAWMIWGGGTPRLEDLFATVVSRTNFVAEPITEFVVRLENREKALEILRASPRPIVQDLLRCRELTNTVLFPSSRSSSGQAFDAALSICGLLLEEDRLTPGLSNAMDTMISAARHGNTQPLEQALMDFMSLGERMDWGQLAAFTGQIRDAATLDLLASQARKAGDQLPVLFSAVALSGRPGDTAQFLKTYSQTGLVDLGASLRYGVGGLDELLGNNQRLANPPLRERLTAAYHPAAAFFNFAAGYAWRIPWLAMTVKWLFYLAAGFLIAMSFHFAKPAVSSLELPLQVRGFHVAREFLFALGFLFVVLLLTEPFLGQESQKVEHHFQLRLPMAGGAVPAGKPAVTSPFMKNQNVLIMLMFFVLQGLLYTMCVVKLAEIRRQNVAPRIKLKLLENEDHLFDAGLYLGFLGTIVSFILSSLSVQQFSLMVAYSSTSFGILFVSFFKICHLRPARRKLVMESEQETAETYAAPAADPTYATHS